MSGSAFVFLFWPPPAHKGALKPEEREIVRRWIAEAAHYQKRGAFEAPVKPPVPAGLVGAEDGPEVVFPLDTGHHHGQLLNVLGRFVFNYF